MKSGNFAFSAAPHLDIIWSAWGGLVFILRDMVQTRFGHGAIVAAKSVVTHDVPPYAIVAGNPAKVVRMRFEKWTVDRLLAVAWWDWPVDKITRNLNAIRGSDITALEAAA